MTKTLSHVAIVVTVGGLAPALPGHAQQLQETNQGIFRELMLTSPNEYRSGAGKPGPAYWQNRADYAIRVALDTDAHRITGSETIRYVNNSPDTLGFVWLQLDQNLFRPGSRGEWVNAGTRWRGAFSGGGLDLGRVEVVMNGERATPERMMDGTRMRLDLPRSLAPNGGELQIEIDWSFIIPEYGADRMGRFHGEDGWVYEIAQWYPRMYVYDDVNGWNPLPYVGQGEFYLDYGDFDVEITVPHDQIVLATGVLQNDEEVLTGTQRERFQRARGSAETVSIITRDEVASAGVRPSGSGRLTWRFRAQNVRDFSWASSRAFIWDATSWEDVLVMAAYPREGIGTAAEPGWERAAQYGRHSIQHYSQLWFRYPYPVAINIAGVVGGMEYPMIVFCGVDARGNALFGVTDHELGHSWFPMVVGSDERRWAWMDEGINTFINHYSSLDFYGPDALHTIATSPGSIAEQLATETADQPIMTHPDVIRREGLGFLAYLKPAYGLVMLREEVLGPKRFDAAFREYIRRWAFKHPQPSDFFRTMENVSGEDLDWFWRGWFFSTERIDQAVTGVAVTDQGSEVTLENRGGLVMPAVVEVDYADGEEKTIHLPVQIWATGDAYVLPIPGHRVTRVVIDPAGVLADADRANNIWDGGR